MSSRITMATIQIPLAAGASKEKQEKVRQSSIRLYQAVNGFSHWFGVTPKVTAEQRAMLEADIRAKTGT